MIRPLADVEKELILAACSETRDCSRAARELGIGQTTLYRKLREYGEPPAQFRPPKPVIPRCPACQTRIPYPLARQKMYGHLIRHGWMPEDARKTAGEIPVQKTD